MANGNGFSNWVVGVSGVLMAGAIFGAVVGYGNDQRLDERVAEIKADVERHEIEQRAQHDAIINIEGDIESIEKQNGRIMKAIEKIAGAQ